MLLSSFEAGAGMLILWGNLRAMLFLQWRSTGRCEVILDVCAAHVRELELIQLGFWRRVLGLSARCSRFVLFTETGVMPLWYRCLCIVLWYLQYLCLLDTDRTVRCAHMDTVDLERSSSPSWAGDLRDVMLNLPCPVVVSSSSDEDFVDRV